MVVEIFNAKVTYSVKQLTADCVDETSVHHGFNVDNDHNILLRLLSVRVEVVTYLVHVRGDPMFPWLVAVVCVAHESGRVRRDDFG